jgi:molybdopterin-guanine dinucleotide biosynthesis protein A
VEAWYNAQRLAVVDFSDCPDAFLNINTVEDRVRAQRKLLGEELRPQ